MDVSGQFHVWRKWKDTEKAINYRRLFLKFFNSAVSISEDRKTIMNVEWVWIWKEESGQLQRIILTEVK
jgi:hypothetical protein